MPEDADLPTFLLSDGKVGAKPKIGAGGLALGELVKQYIEVHSNGAMEPSSLDTIKMHLKHIRKTLGGRFIVRQLRQEHLQSHLTRRAKKNGHRNRKISPVTLRKEVASFRACWNWAVQAGHLSGVFSFSRCSVCLPAALLPLAQNGMSLSATHGPGCPNIGHFFS